MLTIVEAGMLKAMKTIRKNGPKDPKIGICQNVADTMPFAFGVYAAMEELFQSWDMYSGNKTFPVPLGDVDPGEAYMYLGKEYWDRETEYGRNRWALLDHCINKLRQK